MKCPRCEEAELYERDRQNVKVDMCPECRGVWLDRGELEKLMVQAERAAAEEQAYWSEQPRGSEWEPGPARHEPLPDTREPSGVYRGQRSDHGRDRSHYGHGHPRKKKHWLDTLGDIFD